MKSSHPYADSYIFIMLSDSAALRLAFSGFWLGFSVLRVRGGGSHKFFTPHDYRADWPSSAGHLGESQFNKYLNNPQFASTSCSSCPVQDCCVNWSSNEVDLRTCSGVPGIFMLMNKFLAHSPRICDKPNGIVDLSSRPFLLLDGVAPFGFSSFVLSTSRLAAFGHLSAKTRSFQPIEYPCLLSRGISIFKWISGKSLSGSAVGPN